MDPMLNEREMEYVNSLFKWDQWRIRIGWVFICLLAVGGLLVIVTAIVAARRPDDHTLLWTALPGIFLGLLLMVLSIGGIQWLRQRHLVASILKKLLRKT